MARRWSRLLAAMLLASTAGCAYLKNRWRDTLDTLDVGFTFSTKPQFGIYANCPFLAPAGYAKVDGYYAGIGGGKLGVMKHHQDAAALVLWGREDIEWGEGSGQARGVGPLGLSTTREGNPDYKPQCAHYLHLGFVGVTGNLNYREWPDFLLGWIGLDVAGDDNRDKRPPRGLVRLRSLERRFARPVNGLQLFVRTDKTAYTPDEPIVVETQLVNRLAGQDIAVYYEPFAQTPEGQEAEWLFKFYILDQENLRPRYISPVFSVPPGARARYYHHVVLPAGGFVGRRFTFPPPAHRDWLAPGKYVFLVSYRVEKDCRYVVLRPELTVAKVRQLGEDAAYRPVWTGMLHSNVVAFEVVKPRRFVLF